MTREEIRLALEQTSSVASIYFIPEILQSWITVLDPLFGEVRVLFGGTC